ncbi:hypothetical protein SAMN04487949_0351 [Halogranum gelatinilyticum]|jgi:hypothetical protein|uniref:DUF8151 domain-containing protein n=1 Tax=Halogranum gelatinilyticum TaxID=660521 RepID=A0A1G9PE78_9EURY|nr:hypothetical protein [Halogranum gelatinilyticum]SDL97078.1 hypothetical protein SAMN04487949_0351 [Halogranum gelatinilyticum]
MYELLVETMPEFVAIAFFTVGAGALSSLGLYLEELALETLAAGQTTLGLWFACFGLVAFYFGLYLFGYSELLPRVSSYLDPDTTR